MCTKGWALGLIGLMALSGCKRELRVSKGDELFAVLDEAVLEVSLRGPGGSAVAKRATAGGAYSFSRSGGGGGAERCAAPQQLQGALVPIQQIRVRDVVPKDKAKAVRGRPAAQWIQLEVRDVMEGVDPYRLRLLEAGAPSGLLFAQQPQDEQIVLVDRAILDLLSLHCTP